MSRTKLLITIALTLSMLVAIALHQWGLTTYLMGVHGSALKRSLHARATEDISFPATNPRGSALIVHGLNFDASGMKEVGQFFQRFGYFTLIPRLAAHRGIPEETQQLVEPLWDQQVQDWQKLLLKPIICVGYSMGGLLLIERHMAGAIECHRMIVFSPALSLRVPEIMVEVAKATVPVWMRFPSAIPQEYKHFSSVGFGPVFSLHEVLLRFRKELQNPNRKPMPPGLLIIDRRDKVLDAPGVISLVKAFAPHWKIIELKALDLRETHANHLLVDEKHLGKKQWHQVLDEIVSTVNQSSSRP